MIHLTKVQAVHRAYKQSAAVERAKPVTNANLNTQDPHQHFQGSSEERKSFSRVLKEVMDKN